MMHRVIDTGRSFGRYGKTYAGESLICEGCEHRIKLEYDPKLSTSARQEGFRCSFSDRRKRMDPISCPVSKRSFVPYPIKGYNIVKLLELQRDQEERL